MLDLSIIIVNYNVKEFVINLVDSIKKSSNNINYEIIIVDNNSVDGSVELIKNKFPEIVLIDNKTNYGFGKANNQALKIAKGKYLLLINPDTLVKEDTFTKMIKFMEANPQIGLAGCKVLNPDGTLQLPCRRSFPGPWTSFTKITGLSSLFPKSKLFARYNLTYLDENKSYEVDAVSGSFMFFSREAYEKTQGFDEDYFMYGEDLDLCFRVQKAGLKVYYFHETEIIHYKGESTSRSSIDETKIFYDAMQIFVKKNLSTSFIVKILLKFAITSRLAIAYFARIKNGVLFALTDLAIFISALMLAEKYYTGIKDWPGFPDETKPYVYIIPAIFQVIISAFVGSYRKKNLSVLKFWTSLLIGFIIITTTSFFLKQYAFSRAVLVICFTFLAFSGSIWRILIKFIFKYGVDSSSNKKKTLIVGTDEKAIFVADKLMDNINNLYDIQGLISSSLKDYNKQIGNYRIIGTLENIEKIVDNNKIENIIFSTSSISFDKIFMIISHLQGRNIDFSITGNEQDFVVSKSSVTMLDNIPLLNINYNISSFPNSFLKRSFDLVFALFLFPFLFLIFPFTKLSKNKIINKIFISNLKIIIGEMSFVGPESILDKELFLGKKGITGLWYFEKNKSEQEIQRLNIFYAKNQSIWLDFEILGRTFAKLFIDRS